MKIQDLETVLTITKALGLENQGQLKEFYEREQEGCESVFDTLVRYYVELMEVEA